MWNKSRSTSFLFISFLVLCLSYSCKKDNTSGVPSYVKIDTISVVTNYKLEGSASSQISDAWFFADGDELGVFEMPCEIPVLAEGKTNLSLFGGIKQSGVSGLRSAYPFYDIYKLDTTLVQENTITIKPILKYKETVTFPWKEDFDDIAFSIDTASESTVGITRVQNSDSLKEGRASMKVHMTTESPYFLGFSNEKFALPNKGDDVYLEFDYQTNVRIQILVRSFDTDGLSILIPVVLVKSKTDDTGKPIWNKMYAFLSPYLARQATAFEYQIYFESGIKVNEENSGYFMLDNIKIVY